LNEIINNLVQSELFGKSERVACTGLNGTQGHRGRRGKRGRHGETGVKGDKGDRGIEGPPGQLIHADTGWLRRLITFHSRLILRNL